jgi:surface antigen
LAANRAIEFWGTPVPMTGNAGTWAAVAKQKGYRVSTQPAARSIGVNTTAAGFGHVVWVRAMLPDGRIEVEEQLCGSIWGTRTRIYDASYFDGGYVLPPVAGGDGGAADYGVEFNRDGFTEGWTAVNAFAVVRAGALQIDPGNGDFFVTSPTLNISAAAARRIVVRMASNAVDGRGAIYFQTQTEPYFDESKRLDFSVRNCALCGTAPYEDRWIHAAGHPKWRGTIVRLRLDPAQAGSSGTNRDAVGVDYFRVIQ